MKKLTTVLAATAIMFSASAFTKETNETKATTRIEKSFSKDFSSASNIVWRKVGDIFIANFDQNDNTIEAAYNLDGDLVATSKSVSINNLPLAVTMAIGKKYAGYEVAKKGEEITYEKQTNYYINVCNGKEILKLKCTVNGDLSVDKRTKLD